MDRFQELLWDLGEVIELPLHVDKNNACKIVIQEKLSIQLEMDSSHERLLAAAFISELPPGKFRENVLKEAMKTNNSYHPFGIFAYIEKINSLILYHYLMADQLNGEKLADFLELFIEEAESWQSAISMGTPAPPQHLKPDKEQPPPFIK